MKLIETISAWEPSKKSLLASNLLVIALAVVFGWSLLTILWIYWLQSVIIGIFTIPKFFLAKFETGNKGANFVVIFFQIFLAVFFTIHYFGFHLGYAMFLLAFSAIASSGAAAAGLLQGANILAVLFSGAVFFINHLYSMRYNYIVKKSNNPLELRDTFTGPYARILPMHLTIMAASFVLVPLNNASIGNVPLVNFAEPIIIVFFLLLKTYADLAAHDWLHKKDEQNQHLQKVLKRWQPT